MDTLISFREARRAVLESVPPPGAAERVPAAEALRRTLARPLVSREAIPPFPSSAMDGFAVRAADVQDVPVRLPVRGEIPAGASPKQPVEAGTCLRIMTGAVFPEGADAVVPVEWTEEVEGGVQFNRAPEVGAYVRRAGDDVEEGQELAVAGTVVTPPVVGMMARLGYAEVEVAAAPRVAVVATGDELVPASQTPSPGQIRDANGPALAAQVRAAGGAPLPTFLAGDTRAEIRAVLEEARAADVLLISGGMSMGAYDFVRGVLEEMGIAWRFWKVRQRPGKPLGFGVLEGMPVFGLPGNPVSSSVCFEQYVQPALANMLGRAKAESSLQTALLAEPMRIAAGLHYFARGVAETGGDGCLRVRSAGAQGSHVFSSMVQANCFIHFPEDMEDPPAGTRVQIEWLRW